MPKITEMFAFVVADTAPDDEGVIAFYASNGMMMPMCGADLDRIESLIPIAQRWADESGKPMRIYKFTGKEQIGEILPRAGAK